VIDYVQRWSDRTELPAKQIVAWIGIAEQKFYDWKKRYGKVNEHNSWIPRDPRACLKLGTEDQAVACVPGPSHRAFVVTVSERPHVSVRDFRGREICVRLGGGWPSQQSCTAAVRETRRRPATVRQIRRLRSQMVPVAARLTRGERFRLLYRPCASM